MRGLRDKVMVVAGGGTGAAGPGNGAATALRLAEEGAADMSAETLGRDSETDALTIPLDVWQRTLDVNLPASCSW